MPYFAEEDVDTDGEVLVVGTTGVMVVMDVTDKSLPTVRSVLNGTDEHTMSCVLDCSWVYGSAGTVVDLRDPDAPKVAGDWTKGVTPKVTSTHDVTEVSPGMVMTSSQPLVLLDATKDPAHPVQVARGENPDARFLHANLWPRATQDRFLLVGGETEGTPCDDPEAGAFMTYDTAAWKKDPSKPFTRVDSYRPAVTSVPEGDAAYETYCSHWFTPRPGWKDGGQLAVSWYEHGTRFLQVDPAGKIKEFGHFTPVATTASAAYFVTKDVVYVLDYQRGLDILKLHDGPAPARKKKGGKGLAPDVAPAKLNKLLPGQLRTGGFRC
ncbi:MAG: hypothetical protein JWO60_501 [Frankiales bacterium]|nr:hypothetical protein [Frankiales bacterium]